MNTERLAQALLRVLPQYEALLSDCGLDSNDTIHEAWAALSQYFAEWQVPMTTNTERLAQANIVDSFFHQVIHGDFSADNPDDLRMALAARAALSQHAPSQEQYKVDAVPPPGAVSRDVTEAKRQLDVFEFRASDLDWIADWVANT